VSLTQKGWDKFPVFDDFDGASTERDEFFVGVDTQTVVNRIEEVFERECVT
jgi:hypothetical protein